MLTWVRAPQTGWTPLITAAYNEHAPVVKVLLDAGADMNAKDTVREMRVRGCLRRVCFMLAVASRV